MKDLSDLKEEIRELDRLLEDITTDYGEAIRARATRNSKAREYNRRKGFYQRSIPEY